MHGDDEPYGSVQRVEMFNKWPASPQITDNVGIMNRAATQDVRSPVWPVVSRVLHMSAAPSPRDQQVVDILDDWVDRDAPRLDADNDTFYDEAGPVIMDALWRPIANAVMSPVFGSLIGDLDNVRDLDGLEGESYVDKDLRTLLGDPVIGPFNLSYCGLGSLMPCVDSLWQAIHADRRHAHRAAGSGGPEPVAEDRRRRSASCRDCSRTRSPSPTGRRSSRCSSSTGRGSETALDTHEVDEAALRVRVHELHAHPVADVEPLLTTLDATLDRRVEDADPRALGRRAGHDAVELLADAARQETRGRSLPHHPLDLLRAVLLERAFRGERTELVLGVRNLLARRAPRGRGAG